MISIDDAFVLRSIFMAGVRQFSYRPTELLAYTRVITLLRDMSLPHLYKSIYILMYSDDDRIARIYLIRRVLIGTRRRSMTC